MATLKCADHKTVKTTVNLYSTVKQKIEKFAKKKLIKNQTEFINHSLEQSLEAMEKEVNLRSLKTKLHNIKRVKSAVSIQDTLDEIRAESLETK